MLAPRALAQETQEEEAELRRKALATLPASAARRHFGAAQTAAPGPPRIVGDYWKGCFTAGLQLPAAGDHWQTMRRSRNRHWGHPRLIAFVERFAKRVSDVTGWPGILIGDMSQPRGGPMLTGHASHQLGIEADIWLRPMPAERFNAQQVEEVRSTDLLRADRKDVDPDKFRPQHLAMLRIAAESPEVARVFVNAAIKKALCRHAGDDREWLRKIRPAYGHSYHFHIRLACPASDRECNDQAPPPAGDGCGKDLAWWLTDSVVNTPLTGGGRATPLSAMPKACQALVAPRTK